MFRGQQFQKIRNAPRMYSVRVVNTTNTFGARCESFETVGTAYGRGANPRLPAHPDFITNKESHALLVRPYMFIIYNFVCVLTYAMDVIIYIFLTPLGFFGKCPTEPIIREMFGCNSLPKSSPLTHFSGW